MNSENVSRSPRAGARILFYARWMPLFLLLILGGLLYWSY